MKKVKHLVFNLYLSLFSTVCLAQDTAANEVPQMADGLRSSGKIYVVVAVVVTILAGVVLYLVQLDKKISRLEKESAGSTTPPRVENRETITASRESGVTRH